jgi:hypothetical protein
MRVRLAHVAYCRSKEKGPAKRLGRFFAPEGGLEPTANRLTAEGNANDSDDLQPIALGSPKVLQAAAECGRRLLAEIAAGRWDVTLAIQLATTVINDPVSRLAAEILMLGPHTVGRAIELAEMLLRSADPRADRAAKGHG